MKKILLASVAIIFLSGCQAVKLVRLNMVNGAAKECKENIRNTKGFNHLNGKGRYVGQDDKNLAVLPTSSQLSDKTYLTDDELDSVIEMHNAMATCRGKAIEGLSAFDPYTIPVFVDGYKAADEREMKLISKKITWGEYAYQAEQNYKTGVEKLKIALDKEEKDRQLDIDAKLEKAGEFAGKVASGSLQLALLALQAWSAQQATMYSSYRTARILSTNCSINSFGSSTSSSVHCTTW